MKLVIIILNKIELLEDIISGLLEIGITGATVIDSTGMGRILSADIPIFAGLADAFPGSSPTNKTIITVVDDRMVKNIKAIINEIYGDLDEPGTGIMFTIDVKDVWGFNQGSL